jgi:hypothetical protein
MKGRLSGLEDKIFVIEKADEYNLRCLHWAQVGIFFLKEEELIQEGKL